MTFSMGRDSTSGLLYLGMKMVTCIPRWERYLGRDEATSADSPDLANG